MITDGNTAQKTTTPKQPERYFSRDLSWLKFNERVLDQVERPDKTIFERLKFFCVFRPDLTLLQVSPRQCLPSHLAWCCTLPLIVEVCP